MDKREYLFKAKTIDKEKWVEGSLLHDKTLEPNDEHEFSIWSNDGDGGWFDVKSETVCQFSGLPDIMDNKIFDGDLLNYDGCLFTVFYDLKEAGYSVRHPDGAEHYLEEIASESVITGNIHD